MDRGHAPVLQFLYILAQYPWSICHISNPGNLACIFIVWWSAAQLTSVFCGICCITLAYYHAFVCFLKDARTLLYLDNKCSNKLYLNNKCERDGTTGRKNVTELSLEESPTQKKERPAYSCFREKANILPLPPCIAPAFSLYFLILC